MHSAIALPSNFGQIALLILGLAVVWVIVRFVFRLAFRVMFTGCFILLLIGLALVFLPRLVH